MPAWPKIADIAKDVQAGNTKASTLVKRSLAAIDRDSQYQTIISKIEQRSIERSAEIDHRVAKGEKIGKLTGVPFIAKDNFLTFGSETTAASNILRGFQAPYQATVINKLEAEGAICVAKANMDAFAHGSSTENSDFFVTKNPHDKTRVPGGSSGGSAASVVLEMVPFAIGTDTGGSIRLPASFSGAVGLKPSYGVVSRSGVIAMASSTDCIGPLTNNVSDAAAILDAMAGQDGLDSTTVDSAPEGYKITSSKFDIKGKKLGLIKQYFEDGLEEGVRSNINTAVDKLKAADAQISEVDLPSIPLALASYYIVCPAEVSSNLARYDGQRFGFSFKKAKNLDESYDQSRAKGFGAEAKRRIMIGTHVLSSGYYDAYYKKAQIVRTRIINEINSAFNKYDFLIGPTAATVAFKIGERTHDPLQMYLTDLMTVAANMSGHPAISIPAGLDRGLPVGLQIIAPMRADRQLLQMAKAFEDMS